MATDDEDNDSSYYDDSIFTRDYKGRASKQKQLGQSRRPVGAKEIHDVGPPVLAESFQDSAAPKEARKKSNAGANSINIIDDVGPPPPFPFSGEVDAMQHERNRTLYANRESTVVPPRDNQEIEVGVNRITHDHSNENEEEASQSSSVNINGPLDAGASLDGWRAREWFQIW